MNFRNFSNKIIQQMFPAPTWEISHSVWGVGEATAVTKVLSPMKDSTLLSCKMHEISQAGVALPG
jgi:hypothetical protein